MEKRAQFQLVDGAAKTVLRRAFAASDAEVFEAWTNPETLKRWWGPHLSRSRSAKWTRAKAARTGSR